MKRTMTILVFAAALLTALAPGAYADGHGLSGQSVKVANTIQSDAFGIPDETPFGAQGPVAVNDTVEFAECCDGFYAIDVSADQISMKWIGDPAFARVIEPGTFDRYYFTFGEPILAGATLAPSSTLPVNMIVTSPTELYVEVAPGMQVGDGFNALINIQVLGAPASASAPAAELAFTGASTAELAVIGATAVAAGTGLVVWSRKERRNHTETTSR